MLRIAVLSLEEGLRYLRTLPLAPIQGQVVDPLHDTRLALFAAGPVKCADCGISGSHFRVERHQNNHGRAFGINLYATLPKGHERMLTWDHKVPRSLGGSNHLLNAQVLCEVCNQEKGNRMSLPELLEASTHPKPLSIYRDTAHPGYLARHRITLSTTLAEAAKNFNELACGITARSANANPGVHNRHKLDATGKPVAVGALCAAVLRSGYYVFVAYGRVLEMKHKSVKIAVQRKAHFFRGSAIDKEDPSDYLVTHARHIYPPDHLPSTDTLLRFSLGLAAT